MLTQALLAGIERSLALAVARDPVTAQRLGRLAGKVLLIQARDPDWQLCLLPDADGIQLLASAELEPDCTLSAPSALLARLALSSQRQRLLQDPALTLTGDSQVLISLQNIIADLRLDGEAELARWVGPVVAPLIVKLLRHGRDWAGQTHDSLTRTLGEYLTEESRQLIGRDEADVASRKLYDLRLRLERLEARVNQLGPTDPETPDA
ncbi:SCP2 domain-containing protein [Halopseudomonas phragmitis]|uniref:Ubiquinone biosynthesis accessory factor UbiJ n=2 Tax=Pseudomonadaceae TaxID=135621 RepID=A0A1V0B1Z2_9GAMM|nr:MULTISPECIES: SCP2 sterol-binding domain-containing protein [Pseudomonadaceae]AQZ93900.1 hypothetical protein BVH74_03655 [Halopseudomonas phragmitis]RHW20489.1 SCP2 domain-containing protein [Pseudomonas jilinensis]